MSTALIGVGTNLGDKRKNIEDAVNAFKKVPMLRLRRVSAVYETEPWGYKKQDNFYNAVFEVETELSPRALLGVCLGTEAAFGRKREFKNGPRILDLDLLIYENEKYDEKELKLPHPFIGERDFVLVPLKELFPDLKIFSFDFSEDLEKIRENSTVKKAFELDLK